MSAGFINFSETGIYRAAWLQRELGICLWRRLRPYARPLVKGTYAGSEIIAAVRRLQSDKLSLALPARLAHLDGEIATRNASRREGNEFNANKNRRTSQLHTKPKGPAPGHPANGRARGARVHHKASLDWIPLPLGMERDAQAGDTEDNKIPQLK